MSTVSTETALADLIVARCLRGDVSPAVALAQLLASTGQINVVRAALARAGDQNYSPPAAGVAPDERLRAMHTLLSEVTPGCARIAEALQHAGASVDAPDDDGDAIQYWQRYFDGFVAQSEEASVALYSLGSPELLRLASQEIVNVLESWATLTPDTAVLDIGCGIGRLESLIAPIVAQVHGIDISPGMIDVARRRCGDIVNAQFSTCNGRDLAAFRDGAFDLVLAVDSFPYLNESGMNLVEQHFSEVRRVSRDGGHFVMLNFSYRGHTAADRRDVTRLALEFGFDVLVDGETPFSLWDGVAFHLKRHGGERNRHEAAYLP